MNSTGLALAVFASSSAQYVPERLLSRSTNLTLLTSPASAAVENWLVVSSLGASGEFPNEFMTKATSTPSRTR